jgi:hypothetical protein
LACPHARLNACACALHLGLANNTARHSGRTQGTQTRTHHGAAIPEGHPCSTALGAIISGVDLSQPLSDTEFATMHQAFHDHGVIFFRDQQITPEQQPLRGIRHRSTRTA